MPKENIKIAHFNFGHNENKGDSAIILSIQDILKEKFNQNLGIKNFPIQHLVYRTYISVFQTVFNRVKETESAFLILFFRIILYPFALLALVKDLIMVLKVNQCDLVIIGGGAVYSPKWMLPFKDNIINLFKPKVVIFAAGYGQAKQDLSLNQKQIKSLANLHKKANLHSVRDKNTYNLFQNINKECRPQIIIDPAIKLISKKIDNISFSKNKLKIGVNLAYHGWTGQDSYLNKMIDSYSKCLNNLAQVYPQCEFYYLVHTGFEYVYKNKKTSEFKAINLLQEKLNKKMIVCDYSAREFKYIYENLDICISMMLHSSILAFGSGVPFISIGYDQKNQAFMEFIDYTQAFIEISELSDKVLIDKVNFIINNKKTIVAKLKDKKGLFLEGLESFIKKI